MSKSKIKAYLFDWGDTLMVDDPAQNGKMCDWDNVSTVTGAQQTLQYLSQRTPIYIATGAEQSSVDDIAQAFTRVGLGDYISGYFCQKNIGEAKGSVVFVQTILDKLKLESDQVVMIGDSLDKDMKPALELGVYAVWFNNKIQDYQVVSDIIPNKTITKLSDLCDIF